MRSFEQIADAQGWDEWNRLDLLRQFIANHLDETALSGFAEEAARIENAHSEAEDLP